MRPIFALAPLFLIACNHPTAVRVALYLDEGAPMPERISLAIFDRRGLAAEAFNDAPALPGDYLVLVARDAGTVRVLALGTRMNGTSPVGGVTLVEARPDRVTPVALVLGATLPADRDGDGVPDEIDDCPELGDPEQARGECFAEIAAAPDDAGAADLSRSSDLARSDDLAPIAGSCGDGTLNSGEDCDDGARNSDDALVAATCTSQCRRRAPCGDLGGALGTRIDPASGHCYSSWPGPLDWSDANRACQARGGTLAVVTSPTENALVQSLAGLLDHWLGLTLDHARTPRDRWVDGETVGFTAFATDEPNNGGTMYPPESCGVTSQKRGGWDDRPCGQAATGTLPSSYLYAAAYLCENGCGNRVVEPGEGCDPPGPSCTDLCQIKRACSEPGAVVGENGHCYFALSTTMTFAQALTACPPGTHLATLEEAIESDAATAAAHGVESWIGLRAPTTAGVYQWEFGGRPFDSRRWHGFVDTDPDLTTPPSCVRVTSTGWRDRPCDYSYVPLCERE